ncbi:DUF3135 domain-containing protein [Marinobacterium sp. MBR-109]|jgi:hypothetical protein|uniref:DUF3135 domain-containing protein n=1 Tax=Marinobacterium sp. MBR-109 TaxID=3156462 RepID=UPI003390E6A8
MNKVPTTVEKPPFDELVELARSDPDAFEALRRKLVESHIARSPVDQKLKLQRMQFRINGVLKRSSNPVHACILLQNMLAENTGRMSDALIGLQDGVGGWVSAVVDDMEKVEGVPVAPRLRLVHSDQRDQPEPPLTIPPASR